MKFSILKFNCSLSYTVSSLFIVKCVFSFNVTSIKLFSLLEFDILSVL